MQSAKVTKHLRDVMDHQHEVSWQVGRSKIYSLREQVLFGECWRSVACEACMARNSNPAHSPQALKVVHAEGQARWKSLGHQCMHRGMRRGWWSAGAEEADKPRKPAAGRCQASCFQIVVQRAD